MRRARSGAPPGSVMSYVSVSVVDLPAARLAPKSSFRLTYVPVFELTETFGLPDVAVSL